LLGTITEDRTGLTDRYTMELDYQFAPSAPAAPGAPPEFAGSSLTTAVKEQMGIATGADQAAVESHRGRKRAASDWQLTPLTPAAWRR